MFKQNKRFWESLSDRETIAALLFCKFYTASRTRTQFYSIMNTTHEQKQSRSKINKSFNKTKTFKAKRKTRTWCSVRIRFFLYPWLHQSYMGWYCWRYKLIYSITHDCFLFSTYSAYLTLISQSKTSKKKKLLSY